MTPNDRRTTFTPEQLSQGLTDLAAPSRPDYRDDLFRRTERSRQRPAWTFIERWLPMTLVTARHTTAPPLRAAWTLLIVGLLTAALITGLAIAGSQLLRERDPRLSAVVPMLVERDPVEAAGLSVPWGIDVGPDGNLYIADAGTDEIVVVDRDGREIRRFGGSGTGEGQLLFQRHPEEPLESLGTVAVGPDGSVYVADIQNDRVQQFTPEGRFVRAWGGHGTDDGQFLAMTDIAVGSDGTVYVLDELRDDIQRFSPDGEWLLTIGRHGSADGELNGTYGLSVSEAGDVLNADIGNGRVQAWDADGSVLWSRSGIEYPFDVDTDRDGNLYVADLTGVDLFDVSGRTSHIQPDGWDGVGYLAVADDGTVYVSNPPMGRIERLRIAYQDDEADQAVADTAGRELGGHTIAPPEGADDLPEPARGDADSIRVGTSFSRPFTAKLPSTSSGYPTADQAGWWLTDERPGLASFAFVRGPDATPAWVDIFVPAGVVRDPCHPEDGVLTTSDHPSVDELVDALTHQVGVRAGPVTDIRLGDVTGKAFSMDNNIDMTDCTNDPWLGTWLYYYGSLNDGDVRIAEGLPDSRMNIAIVEVHGVPVLINVWELGARRDEVMEAYQLFESMRFE